MKTILVTGSISATLMPGSVEFSYQCDKYDMTNTVLKKMEKNLIDLPKKCKLITKDSDAKLIKAGAWCLIFPWGRPVLGKIQIEEGHIFLCQNEMNGFGCKNKLGFKCSWVVNTSNIHLYVFAIAPPSIDADKLKLKEFAVIKDKSFYSNNYVITICPGFIKVGC